MLAAIVGGVNRRFGFLIEMEDAARDYILASITHPYFKMFWVHEDKKAICCALFLETAERLHKNTTEQIMLPMSTNVIDHDSFSPFPHR